MASSASLKPGEKGIINASVHTDGRGGMMVKSVTVKSNDPEKPAVTLLLKANVKRRQP